MAAKAARGSGERATGVVFPADDEGRRSTGALGRAVVADALRQVDPVGAIGAEREATWRSGYLGPFRRLVEAGLGSPESALAVAHGGLDALHGRMRVVGPDGVERPLDELFAHAPERHPRTVEVAGTGTAERELSLPYRGTRLRGDALRRRLQTWATEGVLEPSAVDAIRLVQEHPEWLALDGHRVVVLGAGAEMGPLPSLLRWGATVVAVDLPRPELWARLLRTAREGAGRLIVPVQGDGGEPGGDDALARSAGADLLHDLPAVAAWLEGIETGGGRLVLGNYVYADGATNVRVSVAVDALTRRLQERRDDLALAFLATPTDVFAVPGEAVDHATAAYEGRSRTARLAGRPLRMVTGGRLLRRPYVPGSDPGVNDTLVPQQGPNYTLAKRLQRWRAAVARDAGLPVSFKVAPPTRTRSVVKNRALAAAYAGAHRFGVEVFEPATSNTLMAALLVHDLQTGNETLGHPWRDEAHAAVHGGLWRAPYEPRSALGLAALLGVGAARG
ncbi:hypothetical protein [Patulibacter americanus]|uniref:hypothetical protein n=1 Tax=Patulibacter americanus TaxID=588672 RepID=UPI0003B4D0AD|nr:hypothetical protein [Patulibacter americanus]